MGKIEKKEKTGKIEKAPLKLSDKQAFVLGWWANRRYRRYDGIICDGAVRSGKTFSMGISFGIWAMSLFDGKNFGICGKTIRSVRRNLVTDLQRQLESFGCSIRDSVSKNYFDISYGGRCNRFYIFGGKDEGSASLIQGITLAGILMDETALMPRSFVEQAVARCSVAGSKLWFNCNPDNPFHWFKREWIDKAAEKNMLYRHFSLEDNPSLTRSVINRYARLYTGTFYQRFVLGKWAAAEGLVYPMFSSLEHTFNDGDIIGGRKAAENNYERFAVSCDYGTVNPSSFGLWGKLGEKWLRIDEYYFDSAKEGKRRTDEEHYEALCGLIGGREIDYIVCDPSAASFIECITRHGRYCVRQADNDVVTGIRKVSDYIRQGKLMFSKRCEDTLREFALYRWDENVGRDCPVKEHDHAMDDMRYFVTSLNGIGDDGFSVMSLDRTVQTERG